MGNGGDILQFFQISLCHYLRTLVIDLERSNLSNLSQRCFGRFINIGPKLNRSDLCPHFGMFFLGAQFMSVQPTQTAYPSSHSEWRVFFRRQFQKSSLSTVAEWSCCRAATSRSSTIQAKHELCMVVLARLFG